MKTKELREKFAKAVLDGRFDDLLSGQEEPDLFGTENLLTHLREILDNLIAGSGGVYLKSYSHEYGGSIPLTHLVEIVSTNPKQLIEITVREQ